MKITIDLEELNKYDLTPDEYVYLYIINSEEDYTDYSNFFNVDTGYLEERGFIKFDEDDNIILRGDSLKLFVVNSQETKFLEFWNNYPMKVPNGAGGHRVLRAKDPDSKQGREIKAKYLKLIKKQGVHENIIAGLDRYLLENRAKMTYLQGIEVFINQQTWEKYLFLDEDDADTLLREDRL
jgi:hypothetical protein